MWVDDERAIVDASDSPGFLPHLFRKDLAIGTEEQLLAGGPHQVVNDVFPDGRSVAYSERGLQPFKPFKLDLARGASPKPLLPGGLTATGMRLSPNGRTMAFVGRNQAATGLYVSPMPVTSEPLLAVEGVVGPPRWSPDGRQIYYVSNEDAMMTLAVETVPSLRVDVPKQLFKLRRPAKLQDVSRDGRLR